MMGSDPAPACRRCGKTLPPPRDTGRTRHYCSSTCRSAARRDRSKGVGDGVGNVMDVQGNLTTESGKAMLDVMSNETDIDAVGSAGARGRAAARELLVQLISEEPGS